MNRTDFTHWKQCCAALGWQGSSAAPWHRHLLSAYTKPQRSYHTLQHLEECLTLLDDVELEDKPLVEMALWFHDAVYDPKATDNEERSAELAVRALSEGSVDTFRIESVSRLIVLTKSHRPSDKRDEQTLIDIDLAILGANAERFDEYERQIRAEYHWVPMRVYREKRIEILRRFLDCEHLYHTSVFQMRFETQARLNLKRLILALSSLV